MGEDGSSGPLSIADVGSSVPCDARPGLCKPSRLAFEEELFTDAACTAPASYATSLDAESCTPPDFIRGMSGQPQSYFRVGPLVKTPVFAAAGGSTCEPAKDKPWIGSIYELGAEVPGSEFATLVTSQVGTGRLRAPVARGTGIATDGRRTGWWLQ